MPQWAEPSTGVLGVTTVIRRRGGGRPGGGSAAGPNAPRGNAPFGDPVPASRIRMRPARFHKGGLFVCRAT